LQLEQLLTKLGVYRQPAKGIFNQAIQFAVKQFQFRVFLAAGRHCRAAHLAGALYCGEAFNPAEKSFFGIAPYF